MNIDIRKATEKDFPAIFGLIQELAEYEKSPRKGEQFAGIDVRAERTVL